MATKLLIKFMLIILFLSSHVHAEQVIEAIPPNLELGIFGVGMVKEGIVKLKNTGTFPYMVDKIIKNCRYIKDFSAKNSCIRNSNIKTRIDTNKISPGGYANLQIACRMVREGPFSKQITIIPQDKKRYKPLKILVSGRAEKIISAKIGWNEDAMKAVYPDKLSKLGFAYSSADLIVNIFSHRKTFKLKNILKDISSRYFILKDVNYKTEIKAIDTKVGDIEKLILILESKEEPIIGKFRDIIIVKFTDGLKLTIPISYRIVGDIYPDIYGIDLGRLDDVSLGGKEVKIFCKNISKLQPDLNWSVNGILSNVLVINKLKLAGQNPFYILNFNVNKAELDTLPKGFVYCRVKIFKNQPTDKDAIDILVYGHN